MYRPEDERNAVREDLDRPATERTPRCSRRAVIVPIATASLVAVWLVLDAHLPAEPGTSTSIGEVLAALAFGLATAVALSRSGRRCGDCWLSRMLKRSGRRINPSEGWNQ